MDSVRRRKWLWIGLEVLLVVALILGVRAYMQRDLAHGAAPAVEGTLLGGEAFSLADLRGTPVLVHFWASWCRICRLEQGTIEALARDHAVITIAMQSGGPAEVRAYLHEHELDMPVLVDEEGRIAARFGVRAVPTTFVLDGGGNIRHAEVGYTTRAGLRARLWLARFYTNG